MVYVFPMGNKWSMGLFKIKREIFRNNERVVINVRWHQKENFPVQLENDFNYYKFRRSAAAKNQIHELKCVVSETRPLHNLLEWKGPSDGEIDFSRKLVNSLAGNTIDIMIFVWKIKPRCFVAIS